MGFGAALGAFGKSALDTYQKIGDEKRRDQEFKWREAEAAEQQDRRNREAITRNAFASAAKPGSVSVPMEINTDRNDPTKASKFSTDEKSAAILRKAWGDYHARENEVEGAAHNNNGELVVRRLPGANDGMFRMGANGPMNDEATLDMDHMTPEQQQAVVSLYRDAARQALHSQPVSGETPASAPTAQGLPPAGIPSKDGLTAPGVTVGGRQWQREGPHNIQTDAGYYRDAADHIAAAGGDADKIMQLRQSADSSDGAQLQKRGLERTERNANQRENILWLRQNLGAAKDPKHPDFHKFWGLVTESGNKVPDGKTFTYTPTSSGSQLTMTWKDGDATLSKTMAVDPSVAVDTLERYADGTRGEYREQARFDSQAAAQKARDEESARHNKAAEAIAAETAARQGRYYTALATNMSQNETALLRSPDGQRLLAEATQATLALEKVDPKDKDAMRAAQFQVLGAQMRIGNYLGKPNDSFAKIFGTKENAGLDPFLAAELKAIESSDLPEDVKREKIRELQFGNPYVNAAGGIPPKPGGVQVPTNTQRDVMQLLAPRGGAIGPNAARDEETRRAIDAYRTRTQAIPR